MVERGGEAGKQVRAFLSPISFLPGRFGDGAYRRLLPFIVIGGGTGCFSFGVVFVCCSAGFWHPPGARQPSRVGSEVIFPCIPPFYILYMERQ